MRYAASTPQTPAEPSYSLPDCKDRKRMTSIAAWAGVDSRVQSSLYISSDSRITFPDLSSWDQGRKVFACITKPHIFAYWGKVEFPALALPLIVDRIDRGFLASSQQDWQVDVYRAVRKLWKGYPASARFSIIHGMRTGENMASKFSLTVMTYNGQRWSRRSLSMPDKSDLLLVEGSGKQHVRQAYDEWQAGSSAGTSRAVFSAFCDSISSSGDIGTGGAPQLAGLYRVGPGRLIGIVHKGQRYFAGAALIGAEQTSGVEWRNELFEITDGKSKRRAPGAQVHERR